MSLLVLGPKGADRSGLAKGLARGLFGSESALLRVSSRDYRDGARVAEILGFNASGSRETSANVFSQRRLHAAHLQAMVARRGKVGANAGLSLHELDPTLVHPLSVVLFEEIENAHPMLWDAILEILRTGRLVLADGSVTSFERSVVVMTSGVGALELGKVTGRRARWTEAGPTAVSREVLVRRARSSANASFPAAFLGRVDEIHVPGPKGRVTLERAFDGFLLDAHAIAYREGAALSIRVSADARKFLLERSRHLFLGRRRLCRTMEVELIEPLLRLIRAGSLQGGDVVDVLERESRLVFYRRQRTLPA